jgi:hypothetical protein
MSNVVSLDSRRPHMAGEAKCLECGHKWAAAVAIGTVGLECPSCNLPKGAMVGLAGPDDGVVWMCNCGCDVFYIDTRGVRCLRCATVQTGWMR